MKRLALFFITAGVAQAQQPVSKEKALDLAGHVHVIFEHKCNECHGSHLKKPEGKFGHVLDLKRLADNLDYIERGKPHRSELYHLVNDGEMPPDDHPKTPPLTGEEKEACAAGFRPALRMNCLLFCPSAASPSPRPSDGCPQSGLRCRTGREFHPWQ